MIKSFEGLRFICAFIIATAHFHASVFSISLFARPALAVEVFFFLSGYILSKKYLSSINSGEYTFRQYTLRRLARLYPLHLFCLLLLLTLFAALTLHHNFISTSALSFDNFPAVNDGRKYDQGFLYTFLINLFFINGIGFNKIDATWIYSSWSTSAEFFICLLLFPILLIKSVTLKRLVLFLLSISAYLILSIYTDNLSSHSNNLYGFLSIGILRVIGGFFAGALIYDLLQNSSFSISKNIRSAIFYCATLALMYIILFFRRSHIDFLGVILIIPIIWHLSFEDSSASRIIGNKYLVILGSLSYSIYLNHIIIIALLKYMISNTLWITHLKDHPWFIPATFVAFVSFTLLLSIFTRAYIEERLRVYFYKKI